MHVDGDANLYRATTLDVPSKLIAAILTLVDHNISSLIIDAEKLENEQDGRANQEMWNKNFQPNSPQP